MDTQQQNIPGQVLSQIKAQQQRDQQPQTPQTAGAPACKKRIRKSPEERLAQLQARAEQLEAQLKNKRRKADTRDKIIIGGWIRALCREKQNKTYILDFLGRFAANRKIEIPKTLQTEIAEAMRATVAARQSQSK